MVMREFHADGVERLRHKLYPPKPMTDEDFNAVRDSAFNHRR